MEPMEIDAQLIRRINRQLRTIKTLLAIFFIMLLAMIAILGFIAYRVVTFTQQVNTKIDNIQQQTAQKLDIKKQLCSDGSNSYIVQQFCQ